MRCAQGPVGVRMDKAGRVGGRVGSRVLRGHVWFVSGREKGLYMRAALKVIAPLAAKVGKVIAAARVVPVRGLQHEHVLLAALAVLVEDRVVDLGCDLGGGEPKQDRSVSL